MAARDFDSLRRKPRDLPPLTSSKPPADGAGHSGLLPFEIHRQPDDTTCGPTCLHAVYQYFGNDVPLSEMIAGVPSFEEGGTLGVLLAIDALKRGYDATLVTWNLRIFDPSWFGPHPANLRDKLLARADACAEDTKLAYAARSYAQFVELGGTIGLRDLDAALLRTELRRGVPILTGLSSTFLYRDIRSRAVEPNSTTVVDDDIAGEPEGHFVVLTGYDESSREIVVSDPLHPNPLSPTHLYRVSIARLIGAIYLGVLTYDGNLIMIEPKQRTQTT
ncbi:MAG: C39 family peptidase [Planctomycetes bacterium]|nr:C39 family peptidase [Planctomycetota bacterium]